MKHSKQENQNDPERRMLRSPFLYILLMITLISCLLITTALPSSKYEKGTLLRVGPSRKIVLGMFMTLRISETSICDPSGYPLS